MPIIINQHENSPQKIPIVLQIQSQCSTILHAQIILPICCWSKSPNVIGFPTEVDPPLQLQQVLVPLRLSVFLGTLKHLVPVRKSGIASLVGGWATPLKNMSSSVGMIIPNVWKNKTRSKPPTGSDNLLQCVIEHGHWPSRFMKSEEFP